MKPPSAAAAPAGEDLARSLVEVLAQSEHVTELVKESVEDLSSVNAVIKEELANGNALPGVEQALEQNEAVESKVQDAAEKLTVVNAALEDEVKDRAALDHKFAESVEKEKDARYAALHDVLTGLPNRALFLDRLEHGVAQAQRHGRALAVLFMDLDKFKDINDSFGHGAGDTVLRIVAQRLAQATRGDDTVSRIGGDEFLFVLLEVEDIRNVGLIAEKFIKVVEAPCDLGVGDATPGRRVEASIGIAIYPKDGTTAEMLVKNADTAMYRAKKAGLGYSFH